MTALLLCHVQNFVVIIIIETYIHEISLVKFPIQGMLTFSDTIHEWPEGKRL